MPVSPRQEFITPFADESLRLLREDWRGQFGAKMLSEELFAIFQQKIPKVQNGSLNINLLFGVDQTAFTIRQGEDGDFAKFVNKFGKTVATIDSDGNFNKTPAKDRLPTRETPVIDWSNPGDIVQGTALDSSQLNAVARDGISGYELPGTYDYSPASGTVLSAGNNQPLRVVFTPDSTGYRRARKTVSINVTPADISLLHSYGVSGSATITVNRVLSDTAMGQCLVVFVGCMSEDAGITFSISDTQGNSYTQVEGYVREDVLSGSKKRTLAAFYAVAGATGANTVTATASGSADFGMTVLQYTGTNASPLRGSSSNSESMPAGLPFTMTTGSVTASATDVIAACFTVNLSSTAGSGYTSLQTNSSGASEHHLNVAGSEAATRTASDGAGSDNSTYCAIGLSLKKA